MGRVFARPRARALADSVAQNPPIAAARFIRARRTIARTRFGCDGRIRRRFFATDECRYEIWRAHRRRWTREAADSEHLQFFLIETRSQGQRERLHSVLPRISGSPIHARCRAFVFGKGGCLSRESPQLSQCP